MCDKIRQMQATIREEERARAAIMENMLKKEAEERSRRKNNGSQGRRKN